MHWRRPPVEKLTYNMRDAQNEICKGRNLVSRWWAMNVLLRVSFNSIGRTISNYVTLNVHTESVDSSSWSVNQALTGSDLHPKSIESGSMHYELESSLVRKNKLFNNNSFSQFGPRLWVTWPEIKKIVTERLCGPMSSINVRNFKTTSPIMREEIRIPNYEEFH